MNSEKDKKPTANAASESVNDQITDAVTQSNVKVVGEAPVMALGNVYQTAAHSTGIMFENAVNTQNQQNILGQAATTQGIMQIYSLDTVADAISIVKMLDDEEGDKGGNGNTGGGSGGTGGNG
ncbi:hypothetical protein GCM10022217_06380 [Chryseobacterium ginsenosidimutans]|uniref:RebB family R body protein n=1 Tax=Chryseobacterium ginsenosidimutans TaxID=687846 RepID=UPI0031CDE172